MNGTLIQSGKATDASQQKIEQALAGGAFFWLDLDIHDPGPDDDVTGLLTNTFRFHPLAVEAADRFGQRARIDDYGMVDAYRDLIGGAMDTHLSMVSNRLNVVMKQLAIIATVFLPLGFLTGFFGQNFAWPITHMQNGFGDWLFLGIGTELVAIILLVILFRRRGWLGSGPTA
jgi:Mg2+ and Co2+ transporter CorA